MCFRCCGRLPHRTTIAGARVSVYARTAPGHSGWAGWWRVRFRGRSNRNNADCNVIGVAVVAAKPTVVFTVLLALLLRKCHSGGSRSKARARHRRAAPAALATASFFKMYCTSNMRTADVRVSLVWQSVQDMGEVARSRSQKHWR